VAGGAGDGGGLSGVVFLTNSMGSVEYAVGSDSGVYLKRGELLVHAAGSVLHTWSQNLLLNALSICSTLRDLLAHSKMSLTRRVLM
jgi:hypothetical protein